jgi:hypothetical protein
VSYATSVLGPPVQIAYAVGDAVAAAERWVHDFGAGPFFLRPHIELVDVMHRGRPATFDHTSAYGQWGSIMVELVQDHSDGQSVVHDVFADGRFGLHHLAYFVDDLESAVRMLGARGHDVAMTARTAGGVEFCFIDAVAEFGHMLELYQPTDRLRRFYSMVAEAALAWDGTGAIRQ